MGQERLGVSGKWVAPTPLLMPCWKALGRQRCHWASCPARRHQGLLPGNSKRGFFGKSVFGSKHQTEDVSQEKHEAKTK